MSNASPLKTQAGGKAMEHLIIPHGGEILTREQLSLIKVPKATESYFPISHHQLAENLVSLSNDIFGSYSLVGESYAVGRQGALLFGVLKFRKGASEIGPSVAFRNSYDRSMSIGVTVGAIVFSCNNLALNGAIVAMRKHTRNIWNELEDAAITTLYKSQKNFEQIVKDVAAMKKQTLNDDEAFRLTGMLFCRDIVSSRQMTVLKEAWQNPSSSEFEDRNMWSFFNATAKSLQNCPPQTIMEKHTQAYNLLIKNVIPL